MNKNHQKFKNGSLVVCSLVLILLYQNCGGGFRSIDPKGTMSSSSSSIDSPAAPTPSPSPQPEPAPVPAPQPNPQPMPAPAPNPQPLPQPQPVPGPSPYANIDEAIASMAPNSWKALPGTMMKDTCPLPYNSYACWAVVGAWSGGDYDEKRNRMLVHGGGHGDSWYNNVFSFDLQTMKWQRLNEMPDGAGGKAPAHWNDIRVETCGFYPKGPLNIPADFMKGAYVDPAKCFIEPLVSQLDFQQPRSSHTYGSFFVDPVNDRYCTIAASTYPSSQTGTQLARCLNPNTGLWVRMADRPPTVGARGHTAIDSRGNVWAIPGQAGNLAEYKSDQNSWTVYGYLNYETPGGTDIDRKRNQIYVLHDKPNAQGVNSLRRIDLNTPSSLNTKPLFTDIVPTGDTPTLISESAGFVYVDAKDRFYAWAGGLNVYSLDPTTYVWKKSVATGDDPGVPQRNGTYGRFRYVPSKGIFILIADTNKNVYIYKPE